MMMHVPFEVLISTDITAIAIVFFSFADDVVLSAVSARRLRSW